MAKKKLLIATDCFLPRWDGIARFLYEVLPKLSESFDITVVAPDFGKLPPFDNVRIITFPTRKIKIGDYTPAKLNTKILKEEIRKTDMIFVQTQGPIGAASIIYGKRMKKPVISYVHSIEWELYPKAMKTLKSVARFFSKLYSKYLYNRCDMIIIPFLELKEIMKKHGVYKPEMVVVQLGMNTRKFMPAEDRAEAKKNVGIDPDRIVIGFTGRIGREKDLPTLVKAFKELDKEYKNVTLLIVGKGIEDMENDFKMAKNIVPVGNKNYVLPYLHAMDIFVLPSLTETTSLATLEAMSCGLPVVVTPVGYVKSYVKDRQNGLFFPKKNSLVLRLKLKQLIDDQQMRESLGKQARASVVRMFDWDKTVEKLVFVLDQF